MHIQHKNQHKRYVMIDFIEYECPYRNYRQDLWVSAIEPHIDKVRLRLNVCISANNRLRMAY